MRISKRDILASLATIETKTPLYFGDMPVGDDAARDIVASSMADLSASPDFKCATPALRETFLLAMLTHVMLDAALLRHQLHDTGEVASWQAARLLAKVAGAVRP